MAQIKLVIQDVTGSKKTNVELPDNISMERLVPALVTKMGLPTMQNGQPLSYALDHKRSGKRLRGDDTLVSAGAVTEDVLIILPTVTAGQTS